jgi:hypothetical protein
MPVRLEQNKQDAGLRANMLRPFNIGEARTSHDGPSRWIRAPECGRALEIAA